MCDVDWEAVKTDYVTNHMSYRALGKKYGISASNIGIRGKREGWGKLRETLSDKTDTLFIDAAAEQRCVSLLSLTRAADNLAAALETMSKTLIDDEGTADPKAVESFARTVNLNAEALRNLYGIPTQAQRHAQQIAEERLAMERKRLDMEIKAAEQENQQKTVRFVIEAPNGAGVLDE